MRISALVAGVFGLAALVIGFASGTTHNIVIGFVSVLLMLMCVHTDRIGDE